MGEEKEDDEAVVVDIRLGRCDAMVARMTFNSVYGFIDD